MILEQAGPSYQHPDDPGEPSTGHPRLSISDLDAAILAVLARGLLVVEIGTGLGVSTRALASTAAAVQTIDIDPWVHEHIWPDLDAAGIWVRKTRPDIPYVDLVFIDANHATTAVIEDLRYARSLNPRIIVCHDSNYDDVRHALDGEWLYIPTEHGLAVQYQ